MSAKIKYTNEPLGKLEVVSDFLPRPEDLVFCDDGVKVTPNSPGRIPLTGRSHVLEEL